MERRDDWNHYHYVYGEGQEATVDFHVGSAVFSDPRHLHGLRVILPSSLDEGAVMAALGGVEGLHVGRLRYADKLELVFQTAQPEAAEGALSSLAGAEVQVTRGWDYFDERVCPTPADWRRIQDREALEALDLDGDGELRVLHRFYGEPEGLARVRERLAPERFEVVSEEEGRLTLAHLHPLGQISQITLGLMRLCERSGVAYDGWLLPG